MVLQFDPETRLTSPAATREARTGGVWHDGADGSFFTLLERGEIDRHPRNLPPIEDHGDRAFGLTE